MNTSFVSGKLRKLVRISQLTGCVGGAPSAKGSRERHRIFTVKALITHHCFTISIRFMSRDTCIVRWSVCSGWTSRASVCHLSDWNRPLDPFPRSDRQTDKHTYLPVGNSPVLMSERKCLLDRGPSCVRRHQQREFKLVRNSGWSLLTPLCVCACVCICTF